MLNLIKYELRRNIGMFIILYIVIAGVEAFTLFGMFTESGKFTAIGFFLLYICASVGSLMILIMGIASYSKELGSKESYMTFMTPTTPYQIIGSKLLTTGIVALVTTIVAVLLAVLDYNIFITQFSDVKDEIGSVKEFATMMGYDISEIILTGFVYMIILAISLFQVICIAYLSITLNATAFNNKKRKGIITFVIFIAISIGVSACGSFLPTIDIGPEGPLNILLKPVLTYVFDVVVIIGAYIGSAYLLDTKVCL